MDPKRKPAPKARPSANPLLSSALYTIVVGPGDHEVEETDGPPRPHRASLPPSPMSLRNLAKMAAPSLPSSELQEPGASAAVGMAGEVVSGVPETVEPPPSSLPSASSETPKSLRDLDTTFVHVASDPSVVRAPPMRLVDCETEVPVEASEPAQSPPQSQVDPSPPVKVYKRPARQRQTVPPPSTDAVDQDDRNPRPPPTPKGVQTAAPALLPRTSTVAAKGKQVRRPLSALEQNLLVVLVLIFIIAFLVWLASPY